MGTAPLFFNFQYYTKTMPVYEFSCKTNICPTYEVWRTIEERDTNTNCPSCGDEGTRLFNPPMMLTGGIRLKEERKEPELVTRQSQSEGQKKRLKESTAARPWMLSRGC